MKKSLFKRAIAAASAVPIALTQCLTFASAADNNAYISATSVAAGEAQSITMDKITYIAPSETVSTWNVQFDSVIKAKIDSGETTGTIDVTAIADKAVASAGSYKDIVAEVAKQITKNPVNYTIQENGDIVITGTVSNLTEAFETKVNNSLGKHIDDMAAKYNNAEIANITFDSVDVSGTFEITVKTSNLSKSTDIPVIVKFTADGKDYGPIEALDYIDSKLTEYKNTAYAQIDKISGIDAAAVKKDVDKGIDLYQNKIAKAKNLYNDYLSKNKSKSFENVGGVIGQINSFLKNHGRSKQFAESGAGFMGDSLVSELFNAVLGELNNVAAPTSVDITAADLGAFADSLNTVEAEAVNGKNQLTGLFEDAEKAEVEAYYLSKNEKVTYDMKKTTVKVDLSDIDNQIVLGLNIERIVETEPITTVTTTSTSTDTTTSSTTTSTETSSTDSTSSTSSTSTTSTTSTSSTSTSSTSSTSTTSTSSTSTSSTSSTSTTSTSSTSTSSTSSTSTTSTSSTSTSSTSSTSTTSTSSTSTSSTSSTSTSSTSSTSTSSTSSTSTSSTSSTSTSSTSSTSTSSTSSTSTTSTESTTTSSTEPFVPVVTTTVKNTYVEAKTTYGFYLDTDEAFNNAQIEEAILHVTYESGYTDSEGEYHFVSSEEATFNITDKVGFGNPTPINTYDRSNSSFRYDVPVSYIGEEDFTDSEGNVLIVSGRGLYNVDNDRVTVEVYIGVKGDANLDNSVDAVDASQVLAYYTEIVNGASANEVILSQTRDDLVTSADSVYDHFAAFLADVDLVSANNNFVLKAPRNLDPADSSKILAYFTATVNGEPLGKETWNEVLDL